MKEKLTQLNMMFLGNWNACYDAIRNQLFRDEPAMTSGLDLDWSHIKSIRSPDYPDKLKHVIMPPFVCCYAGNWDLLNCKLFGIHGYFDPDNVADLKPSPDRCLILQAIDYDEQLAYTLLEHHINHIVVFDHNLDRQPISSTHQLFLSEYTTKYINPCVGQNASRIVMGLAAKNLLANSTKIYLFDTRHYKNHDPHWTIYCTNEKNRKILEKVTPKMHIGKVTIVDDLTKWFQ